MSNEEVQQGEVTEGSEEESRVPREPAPPIESRFLYVDVAALRAKQLRRGAKSRLADVSDPDHPKPNKAERVAMAEVRDGLVEWSLPEFQAVVDTR